MLITYASIFEIKDKIYTVLMKYRAIKIFIRNVNYSGVVCKLVNLIDE